MVLGQFGIVSFKSREAKEVQPVLLCRRLSRHFKSRCQVVSFLQSKNSRHSRTTCCSADLKLHCMTSFSYYRLQHPTIIYNHLSGYSTTGRLNSVVVIFFGSLRTLFRLALLPAFVTLGLRRALNWQIDL